MPAYQFDVVIVGGGAAGLTAALKLPSTLEIALISKAPLQSGSTYYAQGGIAAVLSDEDSIDSHIEDTLNAGAGLCDRNTVEFCVSHGKAVIDWLIAQGVNFTQDSTLPQQNASYHLTQEGGHSHRRVIHADDATGKAIQTTLSRQVNARNNITLFTEHMAIDLLVANKKTPQAFCHGLYAYNTSTECVDIFTARSVILATGGASKVYLYTSNPDTASGDGIAMAWRAGCRVANMEFNQFHPTCLYHPDARSFLLTEAIRGEGGLLKLPSGERFMERFDPRAELAPRDIVARAIDHEMKRLGADCLYLDISHKPANFIKQHFPNIYERCQQYGFDMTQEALPVVPAAHYTCGGVVTRLTGQSDIDGLYVVGESAYTGLHGANRMASNSLLECFVFAHAASEHIAAHIDDYPTAPAAKPWDDSEVIAPDEAIVVTHNWHEIRQLMWDYVGIVRSNKRLYRAKRRTQMLMEEIDEYYSAFKVTRDLLELRNLVIVADLIVQSALSRQESRGLHYTVDYPEPNSSLAKQQTILTPV